MILLADIPGNIIFLIVFAAVGVVNWWLERKKKQAESDETPQPRRPQARPTVGPAPAGESEQERLRRFLEALGVPQQPGAPQPPAQSPPRPMREITPPPTPRPVPRPIERPVRRAFAPQPRNLVPTGRPTEIPVPRARPRPQFLEQDEMKEAGRLEGPAAAIEGISSEFQHMTMEQLGVPAQLAEGTTGPATVVRNAAAPIVESLRLALRSPADLRTVFVTMELLGKPRGLQN
ncbi:MAG: hypothetical protein ABMA01_07400 [Chthoniobacteraceae bacterium]